MEQHISPWFNHANEAHPPVVLCSPDELPGTGKADPRILTGRHHPCLNKSCRAITEFDDMVTEWAVIMENYIMRRQDAVGISSPQLGIPVRMFSIKVKGRIHGEAPMTFVTPILHPRGRQQNKIEGCLSLPGEEYLVKRRKKCTVYYQDLHGERFTLHLKGKWARRAFHEGDHLDGNMISNKMDWLD